MVDRTGNTIGPFLNYKSVCNIIPYVIAERQLGKLWPMTTGIAQLDFDRRIHLPDRKRELPFPQFCIRPRMTP